MVGQMRRARTNLWKIALAAVLVLGFLPLTGALAQRADRVLRPAEVLVLDQSGLQLLGYGTLAGKRLSLELTEQVGDFVLLLVGPFGELERFEGEEDADGALRLNQADGEVNLSLAEFFAGRNLDLLVVRKGRVRGPPAPEPSGPVGPGDDDDRDDDHDDEPEAPSPKPPVDDDDDDDDEDDDDDDDDDD